MSEMIFEQLELDFSRSTYGDDCIVRINDKSVATCKITHDSNRMILHVIDPENVKRSALSGEFCYGDKNPILDLKKKLKTSREIIEKLNVEIKVRKEVFSEIVASLSGEDISQAQEFESDYE